jgi:hypothetical protein
VGGTLLTLLPTVMARSSAIGGLETAEPMGWLMLAVGGSIVAGRQWLAQQAPPAAVLAPRQWPAQQAAAAPAMLPDHHRRLDAGVLRRLPAHRFCAVVEALFDCSGFDTQRQAAEAGDVDINLAPRPGTLESASLVRCRPTADGRIDIDQVRRFEALLQARGLRSGSFVTAAPLTPDVIAFARSRRIELVDLNALLRMIARRPWTDQKKLLAAARDDSPQALLPTAA